MHRSGSPTNVRRSDCCSARTATRWWPNTPCGALSPALIAEYRTALPPTDVIAARLEDVRASILPMLRPEGT